MFIFVAYNWFKQRIACRMNLLTLAAVVSRSTQQNNVTCIIEIAASKQNQA